MGRFIAIPVRTGDSFYLERRGRSILVDGGNSETAFPGLFREHVNRAGTDILVCTHNDADHANGVIGFLEAALTCREIWLPGSWLGTLGDLMRPDAEVFRDIIKGALEFWPDTDMSGDRRLTTIEEVGASVFEAGFEAELTEDDSPREWPKDVAETIDESEHFLSDSWSNWWLNIPANDLPAGYWRLVRGGIEAGERIRRIARLAYQNGIPVRWFQHYPTRPFGGIPSFLHALSARQVIRVSPSGTLFARLALTTVNKQSLVLYSPAERKSPGVLFCADSDLADIQIPVCPHDLITAPHHGAEANESAYTAIAKAVGSELHTVTWVRSDSRSIKRPCMAYRKLFGKRFCTVCRIGPPKQAVRFFGRNGRWIRQRNVRPCIC